MEEADHDDEQHDEDLQHHHGGLEAGGAFDAPAQQIGDQQTQQRREQIDPVAVPGTRCAEHPRGQIRAHLLHQEREVAGDADGDDRDDRRVLQQQIPADEPASEFPEHGIAVGVGGARLRDEPGELRVGQCGCRAGYARDEERDENGRPRRAVGHGACEGEDAGADDAADADGGELPQIQYAGQLLTGGSLGISDVLDGFTAQSALLTP